MAIIVQYALRSPLIQNPNHYVKVTHVFIVTF